MDTNQLNLIKLLAGLELNKRQLFQFRNSIEQATDLDLGELLIMAVQCEQFEAAKIIIKSGYDLNKEHETMALEFFLCSQYKSSKFCTDFYIEQGLRITNDFLMEILAIAESESDGFSIEDAVELIDELRDRQLKQI